MQKFCSNIIRRTPSLIRKSNQRYISIISLKSKSPISYSARVLPKLQFNTRRNYAQITEVDEEGKQTKTSPNVVEANIMNFQKEVLEATRPVLLEIYASWSDQCNQLFSILQKVVDDKKGKVKLVRLNVDTGKPILAQFGIRVEAIPTVYGLIGPQAVAQLVGVQPPETVEKFVTDLINLLGPQEEVEEGEDPTALLAQAEELYSDEKYDDAINIYGQIANNEKFEEYHPTAFAGMALCLFGKNNVKEAEHVINHLKEKYPNSLHEELVQKAIDTACIHESTGGETRSVQELDKIIEENPNDLQARYEIAGLLFKRAKYEDAIDHLLEIIKKERGWNDGAAREMFLKILNVLESTNPELVSKSRRRLANLLF